MLIKNKEQEWFERIRRGDHHTVEMEIQQAFWDKEWERQFERKFEDSGLFTHSFFSIQAFEQGFDNMRRTFQKEEYEPKTSLLGYLYRCIKSVCLDKLEEMKRFERVSDERMSVLYTDTPQPETKNLLKVVTDYIYGRREGLPEKCQKYFSTVIRKREDKTVIQYLSDLWGKTESNIRRIKSECLDRLAELAEYDRKKKKTGNYQRAKS
jgi:DNA-directed RNA polymerase specialized sigma24 family protein